MITSDCAFRWHNKRLYAVLDDASAETVLGPAISMNTGILGLPVKDANTFHDNLMVSSRNTPCGVQPQCGKDASCFAMCPRFVLHERCMTICSIDTRGRCEGRLGGCQA